jgi:hypothetical protein
LTRAAAIEGLAESAVWLKIKNPKASAATRAVFDDPCSKFD